MWPHINVSVDNNNYLQFSEVVPPSLPPSLPPHLPPSFPTTLITWELQSS